MWKTATRQSKRGFTWTHTHSKNKQKTQIQGYFCFQEVVATHRLWWSLPDSQSEPVFED